jgi:hypothetical protein
VIEQEEVMMCSLYCLMEETVEQPIINVNDWWIYGWHRTFQQQWLERYVSLHSIIFP